MLHQTVLDHLNRQIALEAHASNLYLSMASWCDDQGLSGCADFFHRQSEEERMHMLKFFKYVGEAGHHAITPAVEQPPLEFADIQTVFKMTFEHEQKVSASINEIVAASYDAKDYATLNFLDWFVTEQREEEAVMRNIIDRITLIGGGPQSLYYIDKEIANLEAVELADAPTAE